MASTAHRPPDPTHLLTSIATGDKPLAIVLAGHNGSGKSTVWYDKLADQLRIAFGQCGSTHFVDLAACFGPETDAASLGRKSKRQRRTLAEALSRRSSALHGIDYGSTHALCLRDGVLVPQAACRRELPVQSGHDRRATESGYFVVLVFVGLASAELSILRVNTRRLQGGHDVPEEKLRQRFPRTQEPFAWPLRWRT